jgi:hypothetical protein
MLQMHRERHSMHEDSAGSCKVVHAFEYVVLIENMLGRSVIGDQAVPAFVLIGDRIEVQVHDE